MTISEDVQGAPAVTVDVACKMLPAAHRANVEANLPLVLEALAERGVGDRAMILMALGTIRAETEVFLPLEERPSKYNTSPGGRPFDLYDSRKDLGNLGAPDGERYRGRGFVQLTGRADYRAGGEAVGMGGRLEDQPDLANEPTTAAKLLASFLASRQNQIRQALLEGDLRTARRLVNGGSNGLDRFTAAYTTGAALLA